MKDEIVLYRPDQLAAHIEVRLENETVWLNRQQISVLFDRDVKTIGKHINHVFRKGNWMKCQLSQNLRQFKMKEAGWLIDK
jgi:hypothetical protein